MDGAKSNVHKRRFVNGDKCKQPCQIVCGSQCFFGLSAYLASLFTQTIMSSRLKREAGSFWPIITRCFVSVFFQQGRPENDITHESIKNGKNKAFVFLWESRKVSTLDFHYMKY